MEAKADDRFIIIVQDETAKQSVEGVEYEIKKKNTAPAVNDLIYTVKQGSIGTITENTAYVKNAKADPANTTADKHTVVIRSFEKGDYTIEFKENTIPENYVIPENKAVKLTGDNSITINLRKVRSHIKFTKKTTKSADFKDKPLKKVKFSLYKKTLNPDTPVMIADEIITGTNGTWTSAGSTIVRSDDDTKKLADGLEIGSYYLIETKNPDPLYKEDTATKHEFTIAREDDYNGRNQTALDLGSFTNEPWDISLVFNKKDETAGTDIGINHAKFILKKDGENYPNNSYRISTMEKSGKFSYKDSYGVSRTYTAAKDGKHSFMV